MININKVGQKNGEQPERPEMLNILCILTFLGSGLAAFSYFFIFISYENTLIVAEELKSTYPEVMKLLAFGKRFFLTGFFLYSISLYGAIKMWNLKKYGFHLYTAAQILIVLLPAFLPGSAQISLFAILITITFILAYAANLKFMN